LIVSVDDVAKNDDKPISIFLKSFFSFLITFVLMFSAWIVLSGKFDPLLLWFFCGILFL